MNRTMYRLLLHRRFFAAIAGVAVCVALRAHAIAGDMVVWYKPVAQRWTDASPLGNGLTAAMVFGGTKTEAIALNNSSFWDGGPHDYERPNVGKDFNQIKALMAVEEIPGAELLGDDHLLGDP